jgi:hypothetical protein
LSAAVVAQRLGFDERGAKGNLNLGLIEGLVKDKA